MFRRVIASRLELAANAIRMLISLAWKPDVGNAFLRDLGVVDQWKNWVVKWRCGQFNSAFRCKLFMQWNDRTENFSRCRMERLLVFLGKIVVLIHQCVNGS